VSQGVFGIIDFKRKIGDAQAISEKMGAYLKNDREQNAALSTLISDAYVLGMKRRGFEQGQQTEMISRSGGISCSLHGEIHNWESLSEELPGAHASAAGDLDLICQLYAKYGDDFARAFNGMFSVAVLDPVKEKAILSNDRFGMAHQVYWTVQNKRLYFATHLKTLLSIPEIQKTLDTAALNLFLKYAYISSPWTIFKGISKLPPGHKLVFKEGKALVSPYWEFNTAVRSGIELPEAVNRYRQLLQKSIAMRLGNVYDTGILLSGGLDSSANVAFASGCTDKKLKTFAVGFANETFDERPYARIVAKHYNTEHFEYCITGNEIEDLPKLIWGLEEPYFEFGLFLTYLGLSSAQKEVKAVIGGEGADQLFGTGGFAKGMPAAAHYVLRKYHLLSPARSAAKLLTNRYFYDRDNLAFKLRLFLNRATDLNDWYFYGYDEHELRLLHKSGEQAVLPALFHDRAGKSPSSFPALYLETQITQDLRHYVNENVMVKSGRMADMLNLILRESYLDRDVADFLVSLDFPLKRSGDLLDHFRGNIKTKFLHRKAMEGLLPLEIMNKPKQGGFVPVMIFLKDEEKRRSIYRHLLNSKVIQEYFNLGYIKTIFDQYERMQGKPVYWHNFYNSKANRILFLLTFDIWHHLYMRNNAWDTPAPSLSDYLLSGF